MDDSTNDSEGSPPLDQGLFQEPEGFYQSEKPATFTSYTMKTGRRIDLRLVGHSPLWGHLLWNAGQVVARYLEDHSETLVRGNNVLELGAGAGLPSLVASILGAKHVVVTDYPDQELIVNLRHNIGQNLTDQDAPNLVAQGFLWGADPEPLMARLNPHSDGFHLLILADILFNHSEHNKLLDSLAQCLKKSADSVALVFFTPYRPWLLEKDLAFFDLVRERGFAVDKILEQVLETVMFENDPGDETLRKTVFGYTVKWSL